MRKPSLFNWLRSEPEPESKSVQPHDPYASATCPDCGSSVTIYAMDGHGYSHMWNCRNRACGASSSDLGALNMAPKLSSVVRPDGSYARRLASLH